MNDIIPFRKKIFYLLLIIAIQQLLYFFVAKETINIQNNLYSKYDGLIPFFVPFVWIYLSLYLFVLIPVIDKLDYDIFINILFSSILLLSVNIPVFYFYPSSYPRPELINLITTSDKLLNWLYNVDPPNNTFPSMHVSTTFTFALNYMLYKKKIRYFVLIWALLIALSTILIKQHYIIDVIAGMGLATFSTLIVKKTRKIIRTVKQLKNP